LIFLQAKNNKYLKSVHVEFTEKKLQYQRQPYLLLLLLLGRLTLNAQSYHWYLPKAIPSQVPCLLLGKWHQRCGRI